jgi:hypothetical protein
MLWEVTWFPRCQHHVFLSHCAVDRPWLIHPVYDELCRRGVVPWLDQHHYYYGRDSRAALRDGLLRSRHAVFFITLGMMDYTRGWCPMEVAYGDLLQSNFDTAGGTLLNYELPLFFLDRSSSAIAPTIWNAMRQNGPFYDPSNGDPVIWAVDQIVDFLRREQVLALDVAKVLVPGQPSYAALNSRTGFIQRVTHFDPSPIP